MSLSSRFRLALAVCLNLTAVPSSAVYVYNGSFGYGDLSGWVIGPTANGSFGATRCRPMDIQAGGAIMPTMTFETYVGQNIFQEGVPAGLNVGTGLLLIPGCAYRFDLDWGVSNFSTSTNAEGGIFELSINGATIGTASAGFMDAGSYEWGHLAGQRKISGNASQTLIIRILRPYTRLETLNQYVDNVTISPSIFDSAFDSQTLSNFTIFGTSNGQSTSNSVVSGPLTAWNAQMRVGQVVATPGVEAGVDITQSTHLNRLTRYRVDFSYGARNTGAVSNAQGGQFQVVVNGAVQGTTYNIGSIGAGASITGTGFATFLVTTDGAKNLGIRVTRHFQPNTNVFQYVDNVRISKIDADVSGNVFLQNWEGGDFGTPAHFIFEEGGELVGETEASLSSSGDYTFFTPLRGFTNVLCKSTHWLSKIVRDYIIADESTVPINFSLVNGDADVDFEVNLLDFAKCANAFAREADDYGYYWYADLDGDGEITIVDIGIVADNFGQAGDWFF